MLCTVYFFLYDMNYRSQTAHCGQRYVVTRCASRLCDLTSCGATLHDTVLCRTLLCVAILWCALRMYALRRTTLYVMNRCDAVVHEGVWWIIQRYDATLCQRTATCLAGQWCTLVHSTQLTANTQRGTIRYDARHDDANVYYNALYHTRLYHTISYRVLQRNNVHVQRCGLICSSGVCDGIL